MFTVIRYALRRSRGAIIGWGIGLAVLAIMMGSLFDMMASSGDLMVAYAEAMPEIAEMFNFAAMNTPIGWLDVEYFSFVPLIIGLFAAGAGASLLARDEERGTLDLILAHPVSRTTLFWGRFLTTTLVTIILLLISWASLLLTMTWSENFTIPALDLLMPFTSLFAILMFFMTLGLLLSMLLPARSMASMLTAMLVVASFFITLLSGVVDELERAADFSPLTYLETATAIEDGLNLTWFGVFIAIDLVLALISWQLFQRRDIRVGGEGSWRFLNRDFRVVMQGYSSQPEKSPDWIKRGLWAAFLISALITALLALRGLNDKTGTPPPTLMDGPSSSFSTTEITQPTLAEDRLLQGNSDRPGFKELNLDQTIYFLLTGLDKREWEGDTGPGLTDTIIVAFLDTQKQTAGLISIHRDAWVEAEGNLFL